MKCPHCNREFEPEKPPRKPYEYHGYLEEFLPMIFVGLRSGKSPKSIAIAIESQRQFSYYTHVGAAIRYIGINYGLIAKPEEEKYPTPVFQKARQEHAWLLRAEGMTFKKIGARLGVSSAQARVLVFRFGRLEATRAMKRMRWIVHTNRRIEHDGTTEMAAQS